MAVGVIRDGTSVISSGGGDRTVRLRWLAASTPLAHPPDLSEPVWGVALQSNIIIAAIGRESAIHQPAAPRPIRNWLPVHWPRLVDTTIG